MILGKPLGRHGAAPVGKEGLENRRAGTVGLHAAVPGPELFGGFFILRGVLLQDLQQIGQAIPGPQGENVVLDSDQVFP